MTFKIKEAREKIGLTQKELAEELGIKPTTFNGYEKGTHDPKSDILKRIAIKCNTTVDFLLGLDDNSDVQKVILSASEQNLINNYRILNRSGKNKLFDYSNDLVQSGNYIENEQKEKRAPSAS